MSHEPIRRILAFCGLIMITSVFAAIGIMNAPSEQSAPSRITTIDDLGWSLAYEYRVQISPKFPQDREGLSHVPIIAKDASLGECERTLKLLKSELALYPRAFLRKILPRQIIICRDLINDDQDCGAVTDFTHDTLFLNYDSDLQTEEEKRRDIHHEIYHLIDGREDGTLDDSDWAALNPSSFRYGEGHGRYESDLPGFLTGYATTDVGEDKAELFSYLMTDPDLVEARAKTDEVIRRKVEAIQASIARQCPEMDESFWQRIPRKSGRNERNPIRLGR